jgi:hypothetical protein
LFSGNVDLSEKELEEAALSTYRGFIFTNSLLKRKLLQMVSQAAPSKPLALKAWRKIKSL